MILRISVLRFTLGIFYLSSDYENDDNVWREWFFFGFRLSDWL